MSFNRAAEQDEKIEKPAAAAAVSTGNDLDVLDLFKEDRERKLKSAQEDNIEQSGAGGRAVRRGSKTSTGNEQKTKRNPQLNVIERFAELAGRAIPEFAGRNQDAATAKEGLAGLINRASVYTKTLPVVDLA